MLNNQVHFYQFRHLFKGDDYLGKYDSLTKIAHLAPEFEHLRQEVVSFFLNSHGILAKVLVGTEELKAVAPLQEFPDEVRKLMTPFLGDMTPEVVEWAREKFTAKEFNRRYHGRQPELPEGEETPQPDAPPITPPPLVPGSTPVPASGTTPIPKTNILGLPEGAPDDYNELIAFLKSKGVDVPRNTKKAVAVDLYMEWAKAQTESVMKAWIINDAELFAARSKEEACGLWDVQMRGDDTAIISTHADFSIEECPEAFKFAPDEFPENSRPIQDYARGMKNPGYLGSIHE